jgi:hypothetical protein
MKHFKTPDEFASRQEFDAYVVSGVWKRARESVDGEAEWQEYLREKEELAVLLRSRLQHQNSCALLGG